MRFKNSLKRIWRVVITCHILLFTPINGSADNHLRVHELPEGFALYTGSQTATICVSPQEALVVKKAAQLLGNDIRCVTGKHPLQLSLSALLAAVLSSILLSVRGSFKLTVSEMVGSNS